MQQSEKPLLLTVNGDAQLVVPDAKAYQKLLDRLEYMETVLALKEGIQEIEKGERTSANEVIEALRQ